MSCRNRSLWCRQASALIASLLSRPHSAESLRAVTLNIAIELYTRMHRVQDGSESAVEYKGSGRRGLRGLHIHGGNVLVSWMYETPI